MSRPDHHRLAYALDVDDVHRVNAEVALRIAEGRSDSLLGDDPPGKENAAPNLSAEHGGSKNRTEINTAKGECK